MMSAQATTALGIPALALAMAPCDHMNSRPDRVNVQALSKKLIGTVPAGQERSLPRAPLSDARVLVVMVDRAAAGFVNTSLRAIVTPVETHQAFVMSPSVVRPGICASR